MHDKIAEQIRAAVTHWSQEKYHSDDILIADVSRDEDEPERYLVILAARPLAYWLVVEVWFNDGEVETINDLGEGLPLEDQDWPWPETD